MIMSIEGIPEGWELVRVGTPKPGEHVLGKYGKILHCNGVFKGVSYVIIRKIEKPKQFRPFANAAEFEPHREKWLRLKSGNGDHRIKTHSYNDRKHYWGDIGDTWEKMFADYEFEDGTPFGVEVTE